ncbi:MAG: response regulator transcription factor [Deferribacteraceae bacterium]|jgi:two-component system alkaline phosphatase synthesis response regulator PhoP|nr:response regulator transcription factor [Deferribacteraceae bacterium]
MLNLHNNRMKGYILVIDDDKEICELVSLFLKLEGYNIFTAGTGLEGLSVFREKCPDLVILDIGLPDVSGQQICRLIRSESSAPVIILSAKDSVSDKVICLDYGADDYITKPFENIELLARIHAIERRTEKYRERPEESAVSLFSFHHLKIDAVKRQVTSGDNKIALTPKEFELLFYLSKNAGKTLPRDKITEDLWGNDTLYRWSRSLDVHIQNLRQKIEINPKNPEIIKTVSGIGYKVKE